MTAKPKILFCLPSISRSGGGVSEAARLQTLALDDAVDLEVSTFQDTYSNDSKSAWPPVVIHQHRVFGPTSYSFAPGMLWSLLRTKADVIHVHGVWQFHCLAVFIWSLVTGRPYVVTPHGMLEPWIRARSPRLKAMVSGLYQDRFLKRAAGFQILTEKERDDVAEFSTGQPIHVVPNYVPAFRADHEKPGWWQENFEGRDIYLFLGRIHEKKGCFELCDAWARLCEDDASFQERSVLIFCGWNDGLAGFEDKVLALGERYGNALFAGPQYDAEKSRTLRCATFFLLPSKSEGLPMAILEAWSAGLPTIMTEYCNLSLGFSEGIAVRCEPTAESIGTALKMTTALPASERQAMAHKAQAVVENRYSASGVRQALLDLYAETISHKRRPA